jgi:hypothetical protein
MMRIWLALLLVVCASGSAAQAAGTTPLQLSIWSPVQAFPRDWDVIGLRCGGIYSQNRHVYGLDLGLFNRATASSGGLQVGAGTVVSGMDFGFVVFESATAPLLDLDVVGKHLRADTCAHYTGLQLSLLFNHADSLRGLQCGGLGNRAVLLAGFELSLGGNECFHGSGWQLGLMNEARSVFNGVQSGGVNSCGGDLRGIQIGGANLCDGEMRGLQIGLINFAYADRMTGVQIGLLNFIWGSPVAFLPVINAHF